MLVIHMQNRRMWGGKIKKGKILHVDYILTLQKSNNPSKRVKLKLWYVYRRVPYHWYIFWHFSHHQPIPLTPPPSMAVVCINAGSLNTSQTVCEKHHFFPYGRELKYATSTYCKGIQNMTKKIVQMLSTCRKQMLSSLTALWQTSNFIQKIQHSQSGLMTMLPDMSLCFSCTFHVFPHAVLLPIIYDWSAPSLPFSILFNLCNSDLQWLIINTKMYMCVNKFGGT